MRRVADRTPLASRLRAQATSNRPLGGSAGGPSLHPLSRSHAQSIHCREPRVFQCQGCYAGLSSGQRLHATGGTQSFSAVTLFHCVAPL